MNQPMNKDQAKHKAQLKQTQQALEFLQEAHNRLRENRDKLHKAMQQILKDSQELPHINEIARKALEKGSQA